jgi:hypothetical protein
VKKIFLLLLPLVFFLVSTKPAFAFTPITVVEFTNGNNPGSLARIFLSSLPPEAVNQRQCIIYNSNHAMVLGGSVMNPTIGCQFNTGESIIDGAYTLEILNQFNDLNNPIAVSNTFYMVNGRGSLVPPADPTPPPSNLPPEVRQPEYKTHNPGDTYYQAYGFNDPDSTSWNATIDYGDGSGVQPLPLTGSDFTLMHQYTTEGMYLVKLSITDDSGNTTSVTGVVAVVPFTFTPPSLTITSMTFTYTSPNITTLVVEFTPDATFSSACFLYINGTSSGRTASSRTTHSCTFRNVGFSFDFTNVSLVMYNGGTPAFRTYSAFYTHTDLLSVTGMTFNNNAFSLATNILPISNNEACILTNAQGTVVATTTNHIPSNSCVFVGYGFNGPNSLPDGTYRLALNANVQVQSAPFVITRPHRPEIAPLSGATINIGETYTENGSFTDPDSTSWIATVNFSDGMGPQPLTLDGTSFTINKQFDIPGTYNVIVSIKDDQNITNTATTTVTVTDPQPVTVIFNASSDTYVRGGQDNHNYGAGIFMNLQSSGSNRSIVKFDQSELQNAIGSGAVLSAKLQVTITDNGNNWGSTGRTVDLHRMIASWDEGNGTENDRGNGNGATWNCAIDSLIENQAKNCSGSTEWEMGQPNNPSVHPWNETATDTKTITNNQSGVVEFDVTGDVASFMNGSNSNYGWLLKKTNEGQNGQVSFGTRESSSIPQLVVTYQQ